MEWKLDSHAVFIADSILLCLFMAKCPSVYFLLGEQEMVRCVSLCIPRFNLVPLLCLLLWHFRSCGIYYKFVCLHCFCGCIYKVFFSSFIYSVLVKHVGDYEQYSNIHQPEDKKLLELTMLLLHFDLIVNVSTVIKYLYLFKLEG